MKKIYLLTPGPTSVPPKVLESMARQMIHHRTSEFQEIAAKVNEDLKYIFCTKEGVMTFSSSGTGAMEVSVANLLSPGDTAIVVIAGKFGKRWDEICKAYGVNVIALNIKWGEAVTPGQIETALKNNPNAKAVYITQCETSTGTAVDVKAIADVVSKTNAVLVVDAISSLGAMELKMDEWNVDVVVSGSQKGLMIPPGLGFCALSAKAWKLVEQSKSPKYYFDLKKAKKGLDKNDPPFTPAVNLIIGLGEALSMMRSEGIENVISRHRRLAEATRRGVEAMGLTLYSKFPADSVTAVNTPAGIDAEKLVKQLRSKYAISIAGGQGDLKGKIFRLAHLGYMNEFDVIVGLAAVSMGLKELGCKTDIGKGISAAEEVLSENSVGAKA